MGLIDRDVIDISIIVSPDTPVWPGDTAFSCMWTWNMSDGASVNVSAMTMSPHAGTHADTPLHVSHNAAGSESLSIGAFCGPVVVIDVSAIAGSIEIDAIDAQVNTQVNTQTNTQLGAPQPERILLRTNRTIAGGAFPEAWPSLSTRCAQTLVARGLRLLGVDCPSIDDRDSKMLDVHHALLNHGACVLENLDLRSVTAGEYTLTALPMKLAGLDAAPVRALLTPRRSERR